MNISVINRPIILIQHCTLLVNNFKLFRFISGYSNPHNFVRQLTFVNARFLLKLTNGRMNVIHSINDIKDSEIINNYIYICTTYTRNKIM